jgi:putative intracellular protease/amidase
MLVVDVFKGHLALEIKAAITGISTNTDLVIIPGGITSQLQVLDVMVNKPFLDYLKKRYSEWLLTGDHALTPAGRIKTHPV